MESNAPANVLNSNQLAVDRTRLAHERTLMAWIRTATSLISFGFTIYKFFQYLQEKATAPNDRRFGPREFALVMIGTGLMALALATWQHWRDVVRLRVMYPGVPYSLGTILAAFLSVLGIGAFLTVVSGQ